MSRVLYMDADCRLQNRLREFRQRRLLTQQALAGKVGVSRQTIIAVEQGRFVPSVRLALQLARAVEAPVDQVFWIEEGGSRVTRK
jgi:putative transcriptional regulator